MLAPQIFLNGDMNALLKRETWAETEIALCGGGVAVPVALAHDFEFISVKSAGLHFCDAPFLGHYACGINGPHGQLYGDYPLAAQFACHDGAELLLGVGTRLGDDVFLRKVSGDSMA